MFATLNMYDWPAMGSANQDFYTWFRDACRAQGLDMPEALNQERHSFEAWEDEALVFGQTCGWPYWSRLRDKVALIATPSYAVGGFAGHLYRSCFIVPKDSPWESLADCSGAVIAVNSDCSQSGNRAIQDAMISQAPEILQTISVLLSGGHAKSVEMVAKGEANLASIDCVSWHWAQASFPELASQVKIIGWSRQAPGLPLVCAKANGDRVPVYRKVLASAPKELLARLAISGFASLEDQDYAAMALFQEV